MLIKQEKKVSPFEKFMLFQEADDTLPKNRKVINLKASDGRRKNYMDGADMMDDVETDDVDDESPTDTGEPENDDLMDGADMMDDAPSTDNTEEEPEVNGDEEDAEAGDEPVMDDTDFGTDDADAPEEGGDETTTDDAGEDDNANGDENNNTNTDEQIRKYVLYRKFLKLNKTLDSQCEILNTLVSDEIDVNQKYKKISNNLKELNKILSEYMIIKFQNASYIQSMLFYQRILTATDINLNALMDIKKHLNKNALKTSQH